jgi:hypothetical protein
VADLSANRRSFVALMRQSDLHAARGFEFVLETEDPESFIDELTEAGLFSPDKNPFPQPAENPGFFRIPPWKAMEYLTRIAEIAGVRGDVELGSKLMVLVRQITYYRDAAGNSIDNYHTHSACAEIVGSVPTNIVSQEDFEMSKQWLSSRFGNDTVMAILDKRVFQRFLASDSAEALKLMPALRHCTELHVDPNAASESRKLIPVADAYWLEQLLENNSALLGEKCARPGVDCLVGRLTELFSGEYASTHTWMFRAAIEEHEQNADWDHATNAFTNGSRDALNAWLLTGDPDSVVYVQEMLRSESQIVRRVAINAVRENWQKLGESIQGVLGPLLLDIGHIHELFRLLEEHFASFSEPSQRRVLDEIARLSDTAAADEEDIRRKQCAQRNWLIPLGGKGNATADAELERLNGICGPVREHPDLLSWHSSSWGFGPSPFSKEELLAFARDRTLVTRLNAFVPQQSFAESPLKSLSDALVAVTSEYPQEFLWVLNTSLEMNRRTQYGVIAGLIHALTRRTDLPKEDRLKIVSVLVPYAQNVAADEAFWAEPASEAEVLEPTKDWIPPLLGGLGNSLSANDDLFLTDEQMHSLRETSLAVLRHSEGVEASDDPMTAAINNPRGVAFESILQLLLRSCRDADAATNSHAIAWRPFAPIIETELRGCVGGNFEISVLVGSYLAQLIYVDRDWTRSMLEHIFPDLHPDNFACAVAGLSFSPVASELYDMLRHANVPSRALQMPQVSGSGRERLVERIAVAYWWGQESIDSEAMKYLFSEIAIEDLAELLSTTSRWSTAEPTQVQRDRAILLAQEAAKFGLESPGTRKRILAEAAKFIKFLPSVSTSDLEWLLPASAFASHYHGAYDFAESLDRLASESPEEVGQLLEAFLAQYQPSYDYQDRLQSVIRKLNSAGQRHVAIRVLDRLVQGGLRHFLSLYEELVTG